MGTWAVFFSLRKTKNRNRAFLTEAFFCCALKICQWTAGGRRAAARRRDDERPSGRYSGVVVVNPTQARLRRWRGAIGRWLVSEHETRRSKPEDKKKLASLEPRASTTPWASGFRGAGGAGLCSRQFDTTRRESVQHPALQMCWVAGATARSFGVSRQH